ncbi:outer membrane beta-barrel protein [Olleya sp. AS48]|uniref:outer membrane beta-barrel protein n=1 Tax=Olleya sp. AS48 TaxID=3135774 RepID=UPI0030DCB611|tara:strand:- start:14492 stop:15157 length:666 start_codon:yes stop_codon:yes gene_type:complete
MKRLTLLPILLFSFLYVNAQDEVFGFMHKELFIEGNIQYSSIDNQTTQNKITTLGLNPKVGYFILDELALGIQGSYQLETNTTTLPDPDPDTNTDVVRKVETTYYSPGIFARYYFLQLGKRFFTYGELGGNYGMKKRFVDVNGDIDNEVKTNVIDANLNLGLNYFVNDKIIISFSLADVVSYTSEKIDADDAKPINTLNANINVLNNFFQTAQFGVMFILN